MPATNISHLTRKRGDTWPDKIKCWENKSTNTPLDLRFDYSFTLTVNVKANPVDNSGEVFSIVGDLEDAVNGVVKFTPLAVNVNAPGRYFYDIQVTGPDGAIWTIFTGTYLIKQDLNKS